MDSKKMDSILLWVLLIVGIYTRVSSGQLVIDSPPQQVKVLDGTQNVKLDCPVDRQENGDVSWYFVGLNSESLISENENAKYMNSYYIEYDRPTNNYRLVIRLVNRFFEGLYSCKLRGGRSDVPNIVTIVTISVEAFDLPSEPKIEIDITKADVIEGDAVTVMCSAFIGDIPGNFELWMLDTEGMYHNMDNNNIALVKHRFNFVMLEMNVTRYMAKVQCNVTHHLLPNILSSSTPQLNVLYRPEFVSVMSETENKVINIILKVTSNPTARISWHCMQNNKKVDDTNCLHDVQVLIDGRNNFFQLMLVPAYGEIMNDDNGTTLELRAENDIGSDTHIFDLYSGSVHRPNIEGDSPTISTDAGIITSTKTNKIIILLIVPVSIFGGICLLIFIIFIGREKNLTAADEEFVHSEVIKFE